MKTRDAEGAVRFVRVDTAPNLRKMLSGFTPEAMADPRALCLESIVLDVTLLYPNLDKFPLLSGPIRCGLLPRFPTLRTM